MPQIIPTGYVPTIAAEYDYLTRYADLAHFNRAMAWPHFLAHGNVNEGRSWNFTLGTKAGDMWETPPWDPNATPIVTTTTTTPAAAATGVFGLPATIFGIDSKLVLVGGVVAFFLFKDK